MLGLSRTASADDVKSAFRRMAKAMHPDVAGRVSRCGPRGLAGWEGGTQGKSGAGLGSIVHREGIGARDSVARWGTNARWRRTPKRAPAFRLTGD